MGLDIDAWSRLTPYAGPPCVNTRICQMAPEYQTALIGSARALGHIRLRTGLKDINEIREEFGMEPDRCYMGAAHYEFRLSYDEYSEWLAWLDTWNPIASAILSEQEDNDDNTMGARAVARLLAALSPELFNATFGDCSEISWGDWENCVGIYRDFVRACGLAAQDGLLAFR